MGVIRCRESGPAHGHGPPPAQFVLLSGALKSVMQCKEVIARISYVFIAVKVFCKRLFLQTVNFFSKTPWADAQGGP